MMSTSSLFSGVGPHPHAFTRDFARGSRFALVPRFARHSTIAALSAVVAMLLAASTVNAQPKPSSDISGKWTLVVMADQNPITSDLEIKLEGKKVTGAVNNADRGTAPIAGEYADGKLTFSLSMAGQNGPIAVSFTGALKDDGTLAGTMSYGQPPDLSWKAERVKAKDALDVTGKWAMSLEMSVGTATPTLELALDAGKITGKYAGRYGEYPVTGTLKDKTIEFSFTMNADGDAMTITFRGDVAADGQSIKGTASMAEMGDARWTATRVKS